MKSVVNHIQNRIFKRFLNRNCALGPKVFYSFGERVINVSIASQVQYVGVRINIPMVLRYIYAIVFVL